MKIKRIHVEFFAAAILLIVIAWIVFAGSSASTGKPTEKTYARLTYQSFFVIAEHAAQENQSLFEISKLNAGEKSDLLALLQSWHNGAGFFINTNFTVRGTDKKVVIVFNRKLPTAKPTIWNFFRTNPAYMVGYSDGTVGLISPEQFTNFNLSGFVLSTSLATNSEFNIFK
jgi:hypothetical protein